MTQSCEIDSKSCPKVSPPCKVLRNMHTQKAMISSKHFFALSLQSCNTKPHLKDPFAWLSEPYVTQNQSSTKWPSFPFPPMLSTKYAVLPLQSTLTHRTQERRTVQAIGHLPTPRQWQLAHRSQPRKLNSLPLEWHQWEAAWRVGPQDRGTPHPELFSESPSLTLYRTSTGWGQAHCQKPLLVKE